ncbi:MAG: hypothetical protein ACREA2_11400 [Blastocatellia bacterium]
MSDQEKSPWEKVLNELSSPWDWVVAALGAAGGAGVTVTTHGADLGTAMATGALVGVALRKAGYASLHRSRLKRRALGFRRELEEYDSHSERPKPKSLIGQLDRELRLWRRRAISDEEFSSQLDRLIDDFRLFDREPPEPTVKSDLPLISRRRILRDDPEDEA